MAFTRKSTIVVRSRRNRRITGACSIEAVGLLRRAHHHALVDPAARHDLLYGGRTTGDAVVAIGILEKSIVICAVNRHRSARAGAVDRRGREKIQTLEIPTLFRARRACLQLLEPCALTGIYCIKMRIRSG